MYKRELYLNQLDSLLNTDFIKVIVGMRRSGKTYLLKSFIEELLKKGLNEITSYTSHLNQSSIKIYSPQKN